MTQPRPAPYGNWKSPITADLIVSETVGLNEIVVDGADVYWIEARASDAGRHVIVRRTPDGRVSDMTTAPANVRTRVHEYGGGAYTVRDGVIFFANFDDQRLYRQAGDGAAAPITPAAQYRYADVVFDPRGRLICVREDHTEGDQEAVNALVSLPADGEGAQQVLVAGNDFYSSPRLSPDGKQLAWLTWNHPDMPWDSTELWIGDLNDDGSLARSRRVAGGSEESIFQPEWSPGGILHFVSDRSGWWNLYRFQNDETTALCPMAAEFGKPQWVFGMSTYALQGDDSILCASTRDGSWSLARLEVASGALENLGTSHAEPAWSPSLRIAGDRLFFLGGSPTQFAAVMQLDLITGKSETLRRSCSLAVDDGYLSSPQAIEFPTTDGQTAHAFYYPPRNRDFAAPPEDRPPLVVRSHGGPTSAAHTLLRLDYQYWTSRGIAVLDVNYGGSSGYGRAYRKRLNGKWGIVDVDDCVHAARHLVQQDLVDPERIAITGGSAGGYTTLCALTFRDFFRAGASHYGVSDLEALARDTHKFESRYLDRLIGPYPERRDVYHERSPIHFADRISCPVILFQGLEDKVVPPSQAETMVRALRTKKLPVAYVAFPREQHGFRQAHNIKRALDGELYFYSRIFDFPLAEPVEAVVIENQT